MRYTEVAEEAIDNYLLWELCKQRDIQGIIMADCPNGEELKEEIVEKIRQEYRQKDYSLEEKLERLKELDNNPEYRSKIFESCSWERKTVKLEDLGTTLPHFGGLPPEIITGNITDVVEFVRKAGPEEYQSVNYIKSLKEVPEVLNEFQP